MAATTNQENMTATRPDSIRRRHCALLIAGVVVLAQAAFFGWWIYRENTDRETVIRVEVGGYDPRDLLRGQYIQIAYRFENASAYSADESGGPYPRNTLVYAVLLKNETSGLHEPYMYHEDVDELKRAALTSLRKNHPGVIRYQGETFEDLRADGRVALIHGTARGWGSISFGGNRLFVPEGTEEPSLADAVALIAVTPRGTIRLAAVEIEGERWVPRPAPGPD